MTQFENLIRKHRWGPLYLEIWPRPYWSAIVMIEAFGLQISVGAARSLGLRTKKKEREA